MKVSRSSHCAYYLKYHIVWVCKYRRRVLNPGVCSYLQKVLPKLLRSMPGVELELIGFDLDHLHMLLVIPPKYSISEGDGQTEGPIGVSNTKEIQMVRESLLERKCSLVTGLLCKQRRLR